MMERITPNYYRKGKIEVWDFIIDQKMGFLDGNVVKYVTRYKEKNGIEDLKKAKANLEKLIEVEEENAKQNN
jgi:adenine-specific DNA glycosylase